MYSRVDLEAVRDLGVAKPDSPKESRTDTEPGYTAPSHAELQGPLSTRLVVCADSRHSSPSSLWSRFLLFSVAGAVLLACTELVRAQRASGEYEFQVLTRKLQREGLCNDSVPLPSVESSRKWVAEEGLREACRKRKGNITLGHPEEDPHSENWCWISMRESCHARDAVGGRWSWAKVREAAEAAGALPEGTGGALGFEPVEDPTVCDRPESGETEGWWTAEQTIQAHEWFQKYVKVYVLNLPSSVDRWMTISRRLQEMQITATRIPGVDMRVASSLDFAVSNGWIPKEYDLAQAQNTSDSQKLPMGNLAGTLGCAAAHFRMQERIIADGSPLAVAFEDDAWPSGDFVERLWSMVSEELPHDWEVVSLMSRCPYGKCVSKHLTRVQPDANEPYWRCHAGTNWGMYGVLYRTAALPAVQRRWRPVVFDMHRPHCLDVDVALASISDQVGYYAVPASQQPGFMRESAEGSAREAINDEHPVQTTTAAWAPPPSTRTTTRTTTLSAGPTSSSARSSSGHHERPPALDEHRSSGRAGSRAPRPPAEPAPDSGAGSPSLRKSGSKAAKVSTTGRSTTAPRSTTAASSTAAGSTERSSTSRSTSRSTTNPAATAPEGAE